MISPITNLTANKIGEIIKKQSVKSKYKIGEII